VIDQLATEYASQSVVFLEYGVNPPISSRFSRWQAAASGQNLTLPYAMVDSGQHTSNGYVSFYSVYKGMVEAELSRPAQAELKAYQQRNGSQVDFTVQLKNLSGVPLSAANSATIHAIVYEDAHVQLTGRFVRSAVSKSITSLAEGATGTFTLATSGLSGVNWDKLHYLVFVDYRPSNTGAYDMLQAAIAQPLFLASPDQIIFLVDPSNPGSPSQLVTIQGPASFTWQASADKFWLTVTPSSGPIDTQPAISLVMSGLQNGWQEGLVTFTSSDNLNSVQVKVEVYYGTLQKYFLPVVIH